MKGRPISGEEFDRILEAVPKGLSAQKVKGKMILKPEWADHAVVESWRFFLRGLWWSGLRLGESLDLWWDRDDRLFVDLSGKYPMLRVQAEFEKGHKDRLLPIAPEFAEFLLAVPEADRSGRVFDPIGRTNISGLSLRYVSGVVTDIGESANVKVDTTRRTGKVKYASAHDLRRSFGERWAPRVMPQVLMELMRHESIETTMRYYVGRNAETTAAVLWDSVNGSTAVQKPPMEVNQFSPGLHSFVNKKCGNSLGNTTPETADNEAVRNDATQ